MKKFVIVSFLALFLILPQKAEGIVSTSSSQQRIQNRIEQTNQIREQIRNEIQEKKEELQNLREQKREEFQKRLQEIKDARKQKIVENLDRAYANINKRWTTHFLNVLDRLTKILDKVKSRAEKWGNSEALALIPKIYDEINQVKKEVEEQAAKTYTLEITSEEKLGEAAREVHSQLRNDLRNLREKIKDIRESIREVVHLLTPPPILTPKPTS